jgi:hypothetical protein
MRVTGGGLDEAVGLRFPPSVGGATLSVKRPHPDRRDHSPYRRLPFTYEARGVQ